MKLSILICSLDERKHLLNRLLNRLNRQTTPDVEILTNIDNRTKSVGKKRNELIAQAQGDYVCFIDDDDLVAEYYVAEVLKAIKCNPDVVGLSGHIQLSPTGFGRTFIHSLLYDKWFEKEGVYYRCPNHLNPVKRSIAKKVKFPEISFGEDRDYSLRLRPYLKSEYFIDRVLYYYNSRH